jgi:hypothetical protein
MVPVKGHRLHIDVGVQQLRAANLGAGGGVQNRLGTGGQIDPQVLDAVLIPAAVCDLSGVDGERFTQVFGPAGNGLPAVI